MRRVVVTGIGMLTPLGADAERSWQRLCAADSGIAAIDRFDVSDMPCRIAGQIPFATDDAPDGDSIPHSVEGRFKADAVMPPKEQRKVDDFILYGIAAADEAIADSGWQPDSDEARERTGVMIGSGIGGLESIYDSSVLLHERGPRRISPFFIPSSLINLCSGQVSIRHGYLGPNHSVVTACATGVHAIGDAARIIMLGDADVMIAGGAEAAICRIGIGGFAAARALSTGYNDRPGEASRPFDERRDGFVMGEGAGIVVLEELEHAKARGARIYGEVSGYGMSGDAYHITAPAADGYGGFRAMRAALRNAGIDPGEIDYINAHGTSTPKGDEIEIGAVKRLLGNAAAQVSVSSTKSAVGHLLGAAGAIEAVFSLLALRDNIAPPTLNLHDPSPACDGIDLVPLAARERRIDTVLSNSFGFGGTNASIVLRRFA